MNYDVMNRLSSLNIGTLKQLSYNNTRDNVGNITAMVDDNNNIIWETDFSPFMEIYRERGSITQPFRFPGQYYDEETGLNYNYFRDYKPQIGRYMEADLIGLEGGINLYSYVENNPVNFTDPFGLFSWGDAKEYSICVKDCIKTSPDYDKFRKRLAKCKEVNVNCMEVCFGIPEPRLRAACFSVCKTFNKTCQAWAGSILIDDLYRCIKKCKEKKCK